MKLSSVFFTNVMRAVVAIAVAAALITSVVGTAFADNILTDGFGTGSSVNDIANWNEEGDDNDSSTLAKSPDVSGQDSASPDGGRFARIGEDEWICRQISSTGLYNVTLKYYWRGDDDAENNSDTGVVEYRTTSNGNTDQTCNSNENSWEQLATHELDNDPAGGENWSSLQTISLPGDDGDNDSSWFIRFRTNSSDGNENFRVDGISIDGDLPDTTKPTVTINQKNTQNDPTSNSPIRFSVVFSEPVSGFTNSDVLLSGSALPTTAVVTDAGDDDSKTYEIAVSGMTESDNDTVIASIPAGGAQDSAGNTNEASTSTDNQVTYHINVAPVATGESVITSEETPVGIVLDATDGNTGDVLVYTIVTPPAHGDLSGTAPNLTYTPDNNFADTDSFTFKVNDGTTDSNIATVNITVTEICEADEHLNEQTGQCIENEHGDDDEDEECDEGFHWNDEQCVPNEDNDEDECPSGYHLEHNTFSIQQDNEEDEGDDEGNDDGQCVPDEVKQCVLVSDETTLVLDQGVSENASILSFVHSAWSHALQPGASWIWGDNPVADTTVDEEQVFTKTFFLTSEETSASLELASDNGALVKVNGVTIEDTRPSGDPTFNPTHTLNLTNLVAGNNTLEITVINKATPGDTNPQNNPAGLIYKLTILGAECGEPEAEAVCKPGEELLENGSFEDPAIAHSDWDIVASGTPGLEWLIEWFGGSTLFNSVNRPEVANIEIQKNVSGWLASDGERYAELDSDWNGHSGSLNGEPGAIAISQTIDTVPGETYTLTFDFSPRPDQTNSAQNRVEALADGVSLGFTGPTAGNNTNTTWTTSTFEFVASDDSTVVTLRDAGTPNDSVGTFVDNASVMCTPKKEEDTATLVAKKIVCDDESYLPNWGAGGENITATTAQDFLNAVNDGHEVPVCRLEPNWQFEWVTDADSNSNPGDNIVSPAGGFWSLFGFGVGDGSLTTSIPAGAKVWVREVLKSGYVPFSFNLDPENANSNANDVSAEIYCSTDVLNYDNWDWIDPVEAEETYYCVAFNAPTENGEQCNPEASNVLLSSDSDEGGLITDDESGPASLVAAPHANWYNPTPVDGEWIWKDVSTSVDDAANGTTETFTRTFEVLGTPFDSTLTLAVDNSYEVKVNGNDIECADAGEHNYEATVDCAVPASALVNGTNTITFEVTNMDHVTANDPSNNPAGLYYKLVVNENECVVPEEPTATVTMCKVGQRDEQNNYLSGWSLYLKGASVQEDLSIPVNDSNGVASNVLEGNTSYLALASGLWLNSGQTGNWVDAEYSTLDNWVTPVDGFTGYSPDILELQINSAFSPDGNWGPYSSAHEYAQSFVQLADGPANFRIYDGDPTPTVIPGWYGDNIESTLSVDLYKGYAGVTGENGCVTFTDVPYGSYTAGELMQSGWTHYATWDDNAEAVVDGGAVSVNESSEHFTVVNRPIDDGDDEDPEPTTSSETIVVRQADLATDILDAYLTPDDWFFWNDENDTLDNTLGSFVFGPGTAPIGDGSAQMGVSGTQRRNIATYQFKDVPLANIASLSFSTYSQSAGNGSPASERSPYLNFNVDFNNSDTWQRRLVYVPATNGVVVNDAWQTWDAIDSGNALWTWSGFAANGNQWPDGNTNVNRTWNDIVTAFPNAQTRSTDSWFGFRVGEPYADGFTGNVDKVVLGITTGLNTHTTTYDLEPTRQYDDEEEGDTGSGTLVIKKLTSYAGEGNFDFDIGGNESLYDADVVVNNNEGETSLELPTGTYSVTETAQEDWEFASVSCEYEGESAGTPIVNGEQITIHDGETVTCTFHNNYDEDGGGGGGHRNGGPSTNGGQVLGAVAGEQESCSALLSTYMRMGTDNSADEVAKLQGFLNTEMGSGLPETGVFGSATDAAVRAFQIKYWEDVLKPWFGFPESAIKDQDDATGYVYKTTRWKINDLFCPGSEALPTLP